MLRRLGLICGDVGKLIEVLAGEAATQYGVPGTGNCVFDASNCAGELDIV
jgi:hypothetical protein